MIKVILYSFLFVVTISCTKFKQAKDIRQNYSYKGYSFDQLNALYNDTLLYYSYNIIDKEDQWAHCFLLKTGLNNVEDFLIKKEILSKPFFYYDTTKFIFAHSMGDLYKLKESQKLILTNFYKEPIERYRSDSLLLFDGVADFEYLLKDEKSTSDLLSLNYSGISLFGLYKFNNKVYFISIEKTEMGRFAVDNIEDLIIILRGIKKSVEYEKIHGESLEFSHGIVILGDL